MAWTTITNAAVAAGAALTTALMTALRDNIISLANRDPGAPKVLGANLDLIERVEISGSPSVIDFTFTPTDYDEIRFVMARIKPSADDTGLAIRFSVDGGSTFNSGATSYEFALHSVEATITGAGSTVGSNGASSIRIATNCGAASNETLSGSCSLFGPALTTEGHTSFLSKTLHRNAAGVSIMTNAAGLIETSADVEAVRFFWVGGSNFQNLGTITAYGVRNN